jgi:hypothetical protein
MSCSWMRRTTNWTRRKNPTNKKSWNLMRRMRRMRRMKRMRRMRRMKRMKSTAVSSSACTGRGPRSYVFHRTSCLGHSIQYGNQNNFRGRS